MIVCLLLDPKDSGPEQGLGALLPCVLSTHSAPGDQQKGLCLGKGYAVQTAAALQGEEGTSPGPLHATSPRELLW